MHRKHLVAALAAVALAGTALGGPAGAEDPAAKPKANTVVKDLLSPLSLDVTDDGTVFYSQNFAGSLHIKRPGKQARTIYQAKGPGTEVGAVSVDGGSLRFATTFLPEEEGQGEPATALMGLGKRGKFQEARGPVQASRRTATPTPTSPTVSRPAGRLRGSPSSCSRTPASWTPTRSRTAQVGDVTYIADAAGNDILKYGARGGLSTVAVLPPQPVVITEAGAEANELPECVVGLTLITEPVPTDVEVGPDGKLYVTTLPGGPEDPSLGARASVYKVDPKTGKVKKVVSGLLSATGLAVGESGKLFIAELFRGRIAQAKPGGEPVRLLNAPLPADVAIRSNGDIYATVQALPGETEPPAGKVIRIRR